MPALAAPPDASRCVHAPDAPPCLKAGSPPGVGLHLEARVIRTRNSATSASLDSPPPLSPLSPEPSDVDALSGPVTRLGGSRPPREPSPKLADNTHGGPGAVAAGTRSSAGALRADTPPGSATGAKVKTKSGAGRVRRARSVGNLHSVAQQALSALSPLGAAAAAAAADASGPVGVLGGGSGGVSSGESAGLSGVGGLTAEPISSLVWDGLRHASHSGGGGHAAMKRTPTCPKALASAAGLVRRQYCRRNHQRFLDLYTLGPVIGTGGFAVVREATAKATGEKFAAKLMTVSDSPESGDRNVNREALLNELEMMSNLNHPNIVDFKEYFLLDAPSDPHFGACVIVMKLLQGPDLMDFLDEGPGLSAGDVKVLMSRLIDAVGHMHAQGVSHRDLKLENLVLGRIDDISSVTIVDFGVAKAARARERMEGVTGTLWYTAPEILAGQPYTPVVDLWSLGVVLYLLLTGEYPFDVRDADIPAPGPGWWDEYDLEEEDSEARMSLWRSEKREELLEECICRSAPSWEHPAFEVDPIALDLVKGLLAREPKARLTATEAAEHAWLTGAGHCDSATLKHVHQRISALSSATRLEARTFQPGQWILRSGSRVCDEQEVFMIVRGEARVVVEASGPPASVAKPPCDDTLCLRRPGNFLGELTVHYAPGGGAAGRVGCEAEGGQPGSPVGLEAWDAGVWRERLGGGSGEGAGDDTDSKLGLALRTVLMLLRVAHRWVRRRRVSIVAQTEVTVLVLSHEDMRWAVMHDYRMSRELGRALRKRRLAIVRAARAEQRART